MLEGPSSQLNTRRGTVLTLDPALSPLTFPRHADDRPLGGDVGPPVGRLERCEADRFARIIKAVAPR